MVQDFSQERQAILYVNGDSCRALSTESFVPAWGCRACPPDKATTTINMVECGAQFQIGDSDSKHFDVQCRFKIAHMIRNDEAVLKNHSTNAAYWEITRPTLSKKKTSVATALDSLGYSGITCKEIISEEDAGNAAAAAKVLGKSSRLASHLLK